MGHNSRALALALLGLALALAAAGCGPDGDQPSPTVEEAQAMLRLVRQSGELFELIDDSEGPFALAEDQPLSPDQRAVALPQWASFVDYDLAFESFEQRFLYGWRRAKGSGRERALVVGMAAHAAQMEGRLTLLRRARGSDALRAALNEASPEYGVAAGHFDRITISTATPQALMLLNIGLDLLEEGRDALADGVAAEKKGKGDGEPKGDPEAFLRLHDETIAAVEATLDFYDRWGSTLVIEAVRLIIDNEFSGVVDPLAKEIALWLGDTRFRQGGKALISKAQLDTLQQRLLPGDILIERRNWFLSNLGLPGFWPHAELYVGTPAEVAAAYDADPEVAQAYPEGLLEHLRSARPTAFAAWEAAAADGEPHRVLEAISEGVVFSSLYEAALADYIGALRPLLSPLEKARAIERALGHFGKPYDFDFDFLTQSELVCSELVWLAYQAPSAEGRSLDLHLSTVVGRLTLPPNDIVAQFDREWGTPGQQLDFVGFLDGREQDGVAVESDVESLRASWRRPKWDIYQP